MKIKCLKLHLFPQNKTPSGHRLISSIYYYSEDYSYKSLACIGMRHCPASFKSVAYDFVIICLKFSSWLCNKNCLQNLHPCILACILKLNFTSKKTKTKNCKRFIMLFKKEKPKQFQRSPFF